MHIAEAAVTSGSVERALEDRTRSRFQITRNAVDAKNRAPCKGRFQDSGHRALSCRKADGAVRQIHLKSLNSDHSVT